MSESKNLWGGRFRGETDAGFARFNRSFGFDRRLFEADVRGSLAHCEGLRAAGVVGDEEAAKISDGLRALEHWALRYLAEFLRARGRDDEAAAYEERRAGLAPASTVPAPSSTTPTTATVYTPPVKSNTGVATLDWLPPTENSDCANPCRPPDANRATRDDSG